MGRSVDGGWRPPPRIATPLVDSSDKFPAPVSFAPRHDLLPSVAGVILSLTGAGDRRWHGLAPRRPRPIRLLFNPLPVETQKERGFAWCAGFSYGLRRTAGCASSCRGIASRGGPLLASCQAKICAMRWPRGLQGRTSSSRCSTASSGRSRCGLPGRVGAARCSSLTQLLVSMVHAPARRAARERPVRCSQYTFLNGRPPVSGKPFRRREKFTAREAREKEQGSA